MVAVLSFMGYSVYVNPSPLPVTAKAATDTVHRHTGVAQGAGCVSLCLLPWSLCHGRTLWLAWSSRPLGWGWSSAHIK